MSDPRPVLRATYGHWLRVRARVRALEASLAAAEHRLQRDAQRSDDPEMATLAAQLSAERQAMQALASELDAHIATVKRDCAAIEATHVEAVVAAARPKTGDLENRLRRSVAFGLTAEPSVVTCRAKPDTLLGARRSTTCDLAAAPVDENERG